MCQVLDQAFDVSSLLFFVTALRGNNYPHFREKETESKKATQLAR